MDWSVSRISIPVFDLEKSRQFYNLLFNNDNEDYSKNIIKSDECIIYGGDIQLRLYKLKAELKSVDKLQSRRTFPTICIKNLDLVVKNLENNNQLAIFNLDNNHSGIHINKADFTFSWRNNFIHNPTIGGHPAFSVSDIKGLINKLEQHDIPLTDAKVYAMPSIHQVYLFDPNANMIEINQNI
jgi:hypothetical protein